MAFIESIANKTPEQFVEEDMHFERTRARFLERRTSRQVAKIVTFLLGHNTECFAPEPVYGPTGEGFLKSRGVEGLLHDREILQFLGSSEGKAYVEEFRQKVISIITTTNR